MSKKTVSSRATPNAPKVLPPWGEKPDPCGPPSKPLQVQNWVVSRTPAKPGGWHIQMSTADTLASFVVVPTLIAGEKTELAIHRGKSVQGLDVLSIYVHGVAVTMTLVGKIEYRGEWADVP